MVDTVRFRTALRSCPQNLAVSPFNTVVTSPQRFTKVSPRVDYALRQSHLNGAIRSYGTQYPGCWHRRSTWRRAAYHSCTTSRCAGGQTASPAPPVNDHRFQYYRNSYHTGGGQPGTGPNPGTRASTGGGAPASKILRYAEQLRFQNYTSAPAARRPSLRFECVCGNKATITCRRQNFLGHLLSGARSGACAERGEPTGCSMGQDDALRAIQLHRAIPAHHCWD